MVDKKTLTGLGFLGFFGGGWLLENSVIPNSPANVEVGDVGVSIHCPTINEEDFIGGCLESLVDQQIYQENENVKIIVLDSSSTDNTREIAEDYADEVWIVPKGKLNSRHSGIMKDRDADIIVSVDADCRYPEQHWLGYVLRPFHRDEVVAAHGPVLSSDFLYKPLRAWHNLIRRQFGPFSARNSAFRRWSYFSSKGFNLDVDQMDREGELNQEEEYRFKEKLEEVGEVEWYNAACLTSERQMPVSLEEGEAVRKYKQEQEEGVRF